MFFVIRVGQPESAPFPLRIGTDKPKLGGLQRTGYDFLHGSAPNDGHKAVATGQQKGAVASLLTQNVDGLHQKAGSSEVVELHGSIHEVVCLDCGNVTKRSDLQTILKVWPDSAALFFPLEQYLLLLLNSQTQLGCALSGDERRLYQGGRGAERGFSSVVRPTGPPRRRLHH